MGALLLGALLLGGGVPALAQDPGPQENRALGSLKGVKPLFSPKTVAPYVRDKKALLALGKALFFDQQVGSDGVACASCHYHAGADVRVKNALSPGFNGNGWELGHGPNRVLKPSDFPLDTFNSDDTVSSAGTRLGELVTVRKRGGKGKDRCRPGDDPMFTIKGRDVRLVEPRNTPTTINSGFFHRLFWDGRANNEFNGVDPFGPRNLDAHVLVADGRGVRKEKILIKDAALASQAVGPPLSGVEMSCLNRSFADLGRKMLKRRPLALQEVRGDDSALGPYTRRNNPRGLEGNYQRLIKKAFKPRYWSSPGNYPLGPDLFNQLEYNFSFFFGMSVAAYEATLVSDRSPFDRAMEGKKQLGADEQRGLDLFVGKGKCVNCHDGPELSKAATHLRGEAEENGLVENMLMGDNRAALYDNGFYNIGVTPTRHDPGLGNTDPWSNPLSFTRQYKTGRHVDNFEVDERTFEVPLSGNKAGARDAVKGAFKTPSLRNVGLTPPFMHNGGFKDLGQVVDFYDRGGDHRNPELDPDITRLGLTSQEKKDLVAFMLTLTDKRVACQRKPFDGPELILVNGHKDHKRETTKNREAKPILVRVPATGKNGRKAIGEKCIANTGDLFAPGMRVLLGDGYDFARNDAPEQDAIEGLIVDNVEPPAALVEAAEDEG